MGSQQIPGRSGSPTDLKQAGIVEEKEIGMADPWGWGIVKEMGEGGGEVKLRNNLFPLQMYHRLPYSTLFSSI